MTRPLCGAAVTRCTNCQNAVGAGHSECPGCGCDEFEPSTCRKPAAAGQTRCRLHGGRLPQAQAAALERTLDGQARAALDRLGAEPVENPLEALQTLAGEALAVKEYFAGMVARLGEENLRYESLHGQEQLRSEVVLFERAIDRCERVLTSIARLSIDERLAKISDAQDKAMADEMFRLFALVIVDPELAFTADVKMAMRQVAARVVLSGALVNPLLAGKRGAAGSPPPLPLPGSPTNAERTSP